MADTLSTIGAMVGADIKDLRITKIDESLANSRYIRTDISDDQIITSNFKSTGLIGNQYRGIESIVSGDSITIDLDSLGINGLYSAIDILYYDSTNDVFIKDDSKYKLTISSDGTTLVLENITTEDSDYSVSIKYF